MLTKKLNDGFYWVGSLDPDLRIFDIVMYTKFGTTYNSYILKGEDKTVLFEASKERYFDEYLSEVNEITPLEEIDYLVVSHTEPDHSGVIERMLDIVPGLKIICTMGAANFLKEITNREIDAKIVKAGDSLDIGGKTLQFIPAPNLHWPDTMLTYIPEIKGLVTCDFFGAHYCDENITDDSLRSHDDYLEAARQYYIDIMTPFREDVASALDKIEGLPLDIIATGHGPVLTHSDEIIRLYREWSAPPERFEKKTVIIPYVSAYGFTRMMAEQIAAGITEGGDIDAKLYDMVEEDTEQVMGEMQKADGFLLGTPTMVGESLAPIWEIAIRINGRVFKGKQCSAFGSYGWSGEGVPHIIERLRETGLKVYGEGYRARFKPNAKNLEEAKEFGRGFAEQIRG